MTRYILEDALIGTDAEKVTGIAAPDGGAQRVPFGLYLAYDTGKFYINTGSGWSSLAQLGIPVDASGNVSIKGKITSTTSSVPTAAAGANAGTSPPAPVVVAGSTDVAGSITFGTGSGSPAIGDQVDVTFGTAYTATPKSIMVVATNAVTGLKIPCTVAKSTTGFSIGVAVAPAASQANTVYAVDYLVIA